MENKPTIEEEIVKMLRTGLRSRNTGKYIRPRAHLQHRGKRRNRKIEMTLTAP